MRKSWSIGFVLALLAPCSESVVLPFDMIAVQSSKRSAFVMFAPVGCTNDTNPVCKSTASAWDQFGPRFPGIMWRGDCDGSKADWEQICGRAAEEGVAFLLWDGQAWGPLINERLVERLQLAHQFLVASYEEQLHYMFAGVNGSLVSQMRGELRSAFPDSLRPSGTIEMPHDHLPAWFKCAYYKLAAKAETALELLAGFGVYFSGQPHTISRWRPWKFHWDLKTANSSVIEFLWRSEGLGVEQDGRSHYVSIHADLSRHASLRHCELPPWPELSAVRDAFSNTAAELRASPSPTSARERPFALTLDAELAYDWMRFETFAYAKGFVRKIQSSLSRTHRSRTVFYDAMCGSGWFSAVLATLLPNLRVYASDFSVDAVALARRNFERNELGATFLHGDLFSPMREAISRDATARPHYVYLHPPQAPRLPPELKDSPFIVPQPRVSVYTPTHAYHFFHRIASELVDILAPAAVVWLVVDQELVAEARRIFQFGGWRVEDAAAGSPELLGAYTPTRVLELTRVPFRREDSLSTWEPVASEARVSRAKIGVKGNW